MRCLRAVAARLPDESYQADGSMGPSSLSAGTLTLAAGVCQGVLRGTEGVRRYQFRPHRYPCAVPGQGTVPSSREYIPEFVSSKKDPLRHKDDGCPVRCRGGSLVRPRLPNQEEARIVMSDHDAFEHVLAAIHEAVLDDAGWPAVSALIAEACGVKGNRLFVAEGPKDDVRGLFVGILQTWTTS